VGGADGRASASENGRRAGRALHTTICRAGAALADLKFGGFEHWW